MAAKRFAVLNSSGVVVNIVLIDDPMPKDYWPGYGKWLLCLEGSANTSKGTAGLTILTITPDKPVGIGDTINTTTGAVTKFVPTVADDGKGTVTASAPKVVLTQDVAPTKS